MGGRKASGDFAGKRLLFHPWRDYTSTSPHQLTLASLYTQPQLAAR